MTGKTNNEKAYHLCSINKFKLQNSQSFLIIDNILTVDYNCKISNSLGVKRLRNLKLNWIIQIKERMLKIFISDQSKSTWGINKQ